MATYQEMQRSSVLGAKYRIACVASQNFQKEAGGSKLDKCCIRDVLFTYGLMLDVQCYDFDSDDNCWDIDEWLEGVRILNGLLI